MLKLHLILLAGICVCVHGTPVRHPNLIHTQGSDCDGQCASSLMTVGLAHSTDVKSEPSHTEHVIGLELNVGVGGTTGPHGRPEGTDPVTQSENGDSLDGISGPSEAGVEAWSYRAELKKVKSTSEPGRAERHLELASVRSAEWEIKESTSEKQLKGDMSTAFQSAKPQLSISARESLHLSGEGDSHQGKDPDTSSPSSETLNPSARFEGRTSHSPSLPFVSTPLTMWGSDGTAASPLSDPLLLEIGPNLMPKEDGPESLWTEAARPGGGKQEEIRMHN